MKKLILLIFMARVSAETVKLSQVIVEPQNNAIHELLFHTDPTQNLTSLVRKHENKETHYLTELLKKTNVVLAKVKGKEVILMSSPNYTEHVGGEIQIKYLHNALTMNYKTTTIALQKENGAWGFYTTGPQKKQIHTLTVKPRKIAGILIGIQTIEFLTFD
jgi:hypothetical protein